MAAILEFKTSSIRVRPLAAEPKTMVSAEIVLFPGVRYERPSEDESASKPRRRARRRDRLEFDD